MDQCPICGYVDKPVDNISDIQKIIFAFKKASGVPADDKEWNKMYFRMFSGKAKKLLNFFEGDWQRAGQCIDDIYRYFNSKDLVVTLDTIMKHASGWKLKHPIESIRLAEEAKNEKVRIRRMEELERLKEREWNKRHGI